MAQNYRFNAPPPDKNYRQITNTNFRNGFLKRQNYVTPRAPNNYDQTLPNNPYTPNNYGPILQNNQNFYAPKQQTFAPKQTNYISKLQMNYKIGNTIGNGAFATVFHAKDIQRNRYVALKQIQIGNMDAKALELCKKEVELLKKANSVNIIKCYEAFFENSFMYVSLEFADGGDLEKLIHNQQKNGRLLSERTIWYYFQQICCGLRDLHEKRILHRDLKPANVFMNSKGIIKIGDLGLSRIFSAQTIFAKTCNVGTEYYMAPERNENGGYNFKSDIWSLGCLLYELCTYRSPFNGETINVYALHKKISEGKIFPFPSDIYSDQIRFFINCCLSIKSCDRPTSEEAYQAAHRMFIIFEDLHHKYYQNKKFVS